MDLFENPVPYFVSKLQPGSKVLDVGAKNGAFAKLFSQNGYTVTAIEPSFDEKNATGTFTVVQSGIEDFLSKETFTLVFARLVEHLMKNESTNTNLALLSSFVAPGGFLYVTLFGEKDPWNRSLSARGDADKYFKDMQWTIVESEEREFDGKTYAGEMKHWHILIYVAHKPF